MMDAWPLSGNLANAHTTADGLLASALSTADPHLQALAWDLKARAAMAESDLQAAREAIQQALSITDKFSRPAKSMLRCGDVPQTKGTQISGNESPAHQTCVLKIAAP